MIDPIYMVTVLYVRYLNGTTVFSIALNNMIDFDTCLDIASL